MWRQTPLCEVLGHCSRFSGRGYAARLSLSSSPEERRLLPAAAADEEQALGAARAGHDHHFHRHLEHGWVCAPSLASSPCPAHRLPLSCRCCTCLPPSLTPHPLPRTCALSPRQAAWGCRAQGRPRRSASASKGQVLVEEPGWAGEGTRVIEGLPDSSRSTQRGENEDSQLNENLFTINVLLAYVFTQQ